MRSYHQFCPAARALDLVGERWTLLIVRDLLPGPKRYTDLQAGLRGIGPNVLADRLRALEAAGLAEKRRLPPPAASTVYELTALGRTLEPLLQELFRWGLQFATHSQHGDATRASWWIPAVEQAIRREADPALDEAYELRVGDDTMTITVRDGEVAVAEGPAASPSAVISTNHETFALLGRGELSARDGIEQGRIRIEGDPAAARRCGALFVPPGAATPRPEPEGQPCNSPCTRARRRAISTTAEPT